MIGDKGLKYCIMMLALFPKVLKTQRPKALKIGVWITPLSFNMGTLANIDISLYFEKLESLGYIFAAIVWSYLHSNFRGMLQKRMFCAMECLMAIQGHPRSLILVPIESAYATSY